MILHKRLVLVVFLLYQDKDQMSSKSKSDVGLIIQLIIFFIVILSYQWKPPSFISNWITISSPASSNIEILHGLNEVPVKVDVQIKVVNNGVDYIFTGTGTSQRDNDELSIPLGGIVYVYNDQTVVLYPPTTAGIGVAYTGSSTDFNGPASARGLYNTALVRVRAWKASDFPVPLFTISILVADDADKCFGDKAYKNDITPDFVVAQVYFPSGMISEGQGNIFVNDSNALELALCGLVFGFDNENVRLWVPIQNDGSEHYNGAVFCFGDGFGFPYGSGGISESSGTVVLKGYKHDNVFQTTFSHGISSTGPNEISFGTAYSLDTAFVMVREKLNSGNNPGMTFNGVGSSMAGSVKYSGVVYVYNENGVLLYTPSSSNPNSYMIYLGDRWGNGEHPSNEESADVIVTVFLGDGVTTQTETSTKETASVASTSTVDSKSMSTSNTASTNDGKSVITTPYVKYTDSTKYTSALYVFCPDPTVENTTHILTNGLSYGSTVQYTCDCGLYHTSGNITRYCNSNGNWTGGAPNCTKCYYPGSVFNSTYSLSGLNPGSTATYTCDVGSQYIGGDTIRSCLEDGTWSGIPIACVQQNCPDPGNIHNATYTLSGQLPGDTVTYTCVPPSAIMAGNDERICQADGTWSGIPLVCDTQFCPDPGNIYNATYTLSGQLPGETATYTCVPPSTIKAGNVERICQADGTWSGIPLVCDGTVCSDPGDVFNATYTLINGNATYTCISGSSPVAGDTVRTCQPDGSWSGIPVVCVAIQNVTGMCTTCADPGGVFNATYTVVGNTATYTCISGSSPVAGDTVRTCQSDGSWSGIPVVCVNVQNVIALSNPNLVTYDSESLAESIKQTKTELTVEKKSTNAYKRRLTSAEDSRRSACYLGTAGVAVLCVVVLAVIAPDIITILRNCHNFGTIYKTKPKM